MKVLVTGGFGFVGARLAIALHAVGHEVVLGSRRQRIAPAWLPQVTVRVLDWSSQPALLRACADVDAIVHAAGMNAAQCAADPSAALQVNGVGTTRLVEAAVTGGVTRFFYFSTAHVYSSPLQGEIDEQTCPRNVHPYASSHFAGESSLLYALSHTRMAGSVLRLSNGFGIPMTPDTDCWMLLVNDLCRQAATVGKLVLQSSGEQFRDFVSLARVSASVVRLLELPAESLPPVLNLGRGVSESVMSMTRLVQERCSATLGYTPDIVVGARKEAAAPLRYTSIYASLLGLETDNGAPEIDRLLTFCRTHFLYDRYPQASWHDKGITD